MLQEIRMCRFMEAYTSYKHRELNCTEAGELFGISERQFRRLRAFKQKKIVLLLFGTL